VIRLYTGNSKRSKPTRQHDNIIFRLQWTTLHDRTLYSVINSLRIPMFLWRNGNYECVGVVYYGNNQRLGVPMLVIKPIVLTLPGLIPYEYAVELQTVGYYHNINWWKRFFFHKFIWHQLHTKVGCKISYPPVIQDAPIN